ncbi:MAG: hypothetical protein F6K19_02190 [Cyanothece sp. SIO1E1]|nr:hypothetical protein [Cyanothece sp. SIO1E1]
MKNKKNGVVYIVTTIGNDIYLRAAIESAKSVRTHSPDLAIHIYVDEQGIEYIDSLSNSPFSSIGLIENPHYRSKVDYIAKTPFEGTLYLDSDTRLCGDISEMFEVLKRFDIALAHAHQRNTERTLQKLHVDIPPSFPQFNSGVILYKNIPPVCEFLKAWSDIFHKAGFKKDQVTLRELLWQSSLRIATLPPEYNIRYEKYLEIWGEQEAKPRILHMKKYHESA